MTTNSLKKTIYLRATKEQVWAFLTDPEKLAMWFHKPQGPLAQGEAYEMYGAESGDLLLWGTVTKAVPHDILEYTFSAKPLGDMVSNVKWTLDAVEGGTRLSLEHSGWPDGPEAFDRTLSFDKGWDEHLLRMRAIES